MVKRSHFTLFFLCIYLVLYPGIMFGQPLAEGGDANQHGESGKGSSNEHPPIRDDKESVANRCATRSETKHEETVAKDSLIRDRILSRGHRFFAGSKFGPTVGTFGGPDANRFDIESAYALGILVNVFARLKFTERWSMQSELAYSTRGARYVVDGNKRPPFDLSYFEFFIAAHAAWHLSRVHPRLALHSFLGASVGYLIRAAQGNTELTEVAGTDFGFYGGAGVSLALPFGTPLLDIRYYYGMRDIDGSHLDINHRAFSFLLGYEVPIPFW